MSFYVNRVTALDNKCQPTLAADDVDDDAESQAAIAEHRLVAERLKREYFVDVVVVPISSGASDDQLDELSRKPDAIFPNNSISFHADATSGVAKVVLYPMSPGRVNEVPPLILANIARSHTTIQTHDLRELTANDASAVMEGTGAINFTSDGTALFIGISKRASPAVVPTVRSLLGIDSLSNVFLFHATDHHGVPIYHTNVVGWVGSGICAWCFESMSFGGATPEEEQQEKERLMTFLRDRVCYGNAERVLFLTRDQALHHFSGNCLEVRRTLQVDGTPTVVPLLCMSAAAWGGYTAQQQQVLLEHYHGESNIAVFPIPTIERLGGGSVRCLLAASTPLPPPRATTATTFSGESSVGPITRHMDVFQSLVSSSVV